VTVYNGAATLRRAVESVLRQTHPDCLIHISDDASTDESWQIAEELAASHRNIAFTRQPRNLGPTGNYRFLLQQATTPYFMWLAADDYLEPTYVERMLAVLESDPGLVTCVSQVQFVRPDGSSRLAAGTYPLQADTVTNLATYLASPNDNARQYGLHRTQPLQKAFPTGTFQIAYDWAVMAGTLLYGRHAEVPETLMVREETSLQSYMALIRRRARWRLERVFPLLPMSLDLVFRQRIPLRLPVVKALLHINIFQHFQYAQEFHPRYARLEPFVRRHLLWRLENRPPMVKPDPGQREAQATDQ
jgi:glycosyltransferase involved in cell wall biosynthesis